GHQSLLPAIRKGYTELPLHRQYNSLDENYAKARQQPACGCVNRCVDAFHIETVAAAAGPRKASVIRQLRHAAGTPGTEDFATTIARARRAAVCPSPLTLTHLSSIACGPPRGRGPNPSPALRTCFYANRIFLHPPGK